MKRYFHLLLLLTLLPLAGWAQNVNWIPYTTQEYPIPYGLSGSNLSSLASKLSVTSGYNDETCLFSSTSISYPSANNQYNLALYDTWQHANSGTSTGLVTTTCETGKNYHLRVSVRHRMGPSTYQNNYVTMIIKIVRADNGITSPFTIENWNYGEPRKYPTIPTTIDGSTPNIQYSADGENWGEYDDIVNDFPGDWYVRAYVPQSTNYNVLSEVRQFRINPIPVNLTLGEVTKTWEKPWNNPTIDDLTSASYTVSGASWNDIKPYLKWDQVEPVVSAGTFKYTLKVTGKSIYGININDSKAILKVEKADATLSTVGNGPSLTYNGKPQTLNADATPEFKDKGGNVAGDILYTLTPSDDSSWSTEVPKETDAGSYTVFYKGDGDVNHNSVAQKSYTVVINKRTLTTDDFNPQTAKDPSPVYTGSELELVNPVTFKGEFAAELATACTVKYQVDGGAEADVAKAVNAKPNYEVKAIFKFGADANFENGTLYTINNAAIVKADAGDITVTAAENLKFKYDPVGNMAVNQPLITAGTCPGATVMYSRTGAAGSYSATIPTGNHTDDYTVYYYAKGDANHNDKGSEASPVGSVEVKIAKTDYVLAQAPAAAKGVVYNAKEQSLLAQGCKRDETLCPVAVVTYFLDNDHSNPISGSDFKNVKATDAGTYKVSWFVSAAPPFANDYKPVSGSLEDAEIEQKGLLVTATRFEKIYDKQPIDKKSFLEGKGFEAGEDVAQQKEILAELVNVEGYNETNAGWYNVTLSAISPAPTNLNYKVGEVWVPEAKLTINPAPLKVKADNNNKVYKEEDPELTASVDASTPLVGEDKLADMNLKVTRAKGEDVGHYEITATASDKNYDITFVKGDFAITPLEVTPAAPEAAEGLVYSKDEKQALLKGYTLPEGVEVSYTIDGTPATKVEAEDAKTYVVGYTFAPVNANYTVAASAATGTVNATIAAQVAKPAAPEALMGLIYSKGVKQTLINQPALPEGVEVSYTIDGEAVTKVEAEDAKTYEVGYTFAPVNTNYAIDPAYESGSVNATIAAQVAQPAAPEALMGLIYSKGVKQTLINQPALPEGVEVSYTIDGEAVAKAEAEDAKTYEVGYTFAPVNTNYAIDPAYVSGTVNATIAAQVAKPAAPTAQLGLVYNGEAQTLINQPAIPEGVEVSYTIDGEAVTKVEAEDAKTYEVGYAFAPVNTNYAIDPAYESGTVNATIAQKPVTPTAPKAHALTYNGLPQALVDAGFAEGATIQYSVDGGEFADAIPEAKDAATYNVSYQFTVDPNYTFGNALEAGSFDVKLNPASITYSLGNQTVDYTGSAATPKENEAYQITNGALMVGDGDAFTFEFTEINATDANEDGVPFTKLKTIWKNEDVQNYAIQFNLTGKLFIKKAVVKVTAPKAFSGLAFNDADQQLIEEPATAVFNGEPFEFLYSGNGKASDDFTEIVAKEAGEYEISWKVNDPGKNFKFVDADEKDAAEGTIKAVIDAKKAWDAEVPAFADGDIVETYNGTDFAKTLDPVKFMLSDGEKVLTAVQDYTVEVNEKVLGTMPVDKVGTIYDIKTAEIKNAGVYTVTYKGVANYAGLTEEYTIEVLPKDIAEFETKDFENIPQATGLVYDKKKDNFVEPVVKYVVSKESTLTLVKATDKQDNDYTLAVTKAGEEVTEVRNAGDYVYTFTGKGNYTGTKEFPVNIKKAELIVIAPNATKTYDATAAVEDDEFEELTYSGLQKGDHVDLGELKVADVVTVPANAINVGEYTLTIDVTEFPEQENYEISKTNTLPGTLTIDPAAPVKISFSKDAKFGKQYSQKDNLNFTAADLVVNEGDGELFDGLAKAAPLLVLSREEGEDVGDYTLNINFATTPKATAEAAATFKKNYEDVTFGTGTFTIVPLEAALKVSIAAASSTYNGKAPQLAWADDLSNMVVTGLPAGKDKAGIFTTLPTITIVDDDDNVVTDATANAGEYNIQLSGGVSKNYTTVAIIGSYYTIEPVAVEAEFNTIPVAAVGVPAEEIMEQVTFTVKAVYEEDEATLAANMDKFEAQWTDLAALVDKDGKIKEGADGKDALVIAYTGKEAEANFVIENAPVYGSLNIGTEGGEIALNDGENIVTYASEGTTVTFSNSRAIKADVWQACVLPCTISIQEFSKAFGYAAIDVLDEERTQGDEIHFSLKVTGDIEAGVPFLFKANGNVENFTKITLNDVDVASTADLVEKGINVVTDPDNNVKFIGTFETVNLTTSGYRYISGGKWYNTKDGYANPYVIKPLRAYLDLTEMTSAADARIFIEEPDGTETAIDAIEFANDINGESIYTVDGKKVSKAAQKGVYIRQGRVIVQ